MPRVKVWNDNDYDFSQEFKGEKVKVPAKGFIEMDFIEAVEFKGLFSPMVMKNDDEPDPRYFKKIRVEQPKEPVVHVDDLTCHANGKKAATPEQLQAMLGEFADRLVKDKDAEKAAQKEDPRISAMQAQIEELKKMIAGQQTQKAGGRPKKEAVG